MTTKTPVTTYTEETTFKFILVGDSSVGKTAICKRFCQGQFDQDEPQTVAVEFDSKVVQVGDTKVKLNIWDTAGQEKFRSMTRAYFRSSAGVFLVFDVTNRTSFTNIDVWLKDAQKLTLPSSVKVLIGNKTDLGDARSVSRTEAEAYAEKNGLTFFETSALSGDRIEESFMDAAEKVQKLVASGTIQVKEAQTTQVQLESPAPSEARGSCC
jgi:small GTP-binding protein